ncbi:DegT/DnrJ/EryC1/StrS family aminotransferase [candidate division KSB1 bacterium]|nr:DegT/DnrJ/EryC1/StrS family aminotransferase [candidate division KSB1 bacterium]
MSKLSDLAIKGGTPVRDDKNPLHQVFPRTLPVKEHLELVRAVDEAGLLRDTIGEFENAVKEAWGVKYAVGITNCTAAVHVAVAALDLEPGSEIAINAISDYGSAQGILSENCVPAFADVDLQSGIPGGADFEKVITKKTKAILVVHWYGQMCDMDSIMAVARKHNLPVIEDCCQVPLVKYKGKIAGTMGNAGTPAFSPEKTLSASGGGMVITNDQRIAELANVYTNLRGVEEFREKFGRIHSRLGYNYRYDVFRAALGLVQLKVFPPKLKRRMELAELLNEKVNRIDGIRSTRSPLKEAEHGYWLYAIQVDPDQFNCTPDEFADALNAEGLKICGTARYYLLPETMTMLHKGTREYQRRIKVNPWLEDYDFSGDMVPNARAHLDRSIRWMWSYKHTEKDIDDIAKMIEKVADAYRK